MDISSKGAIWNIDEINNPMGSLGVLGKVFKELLLALIGGDLAKHVR